jgi:serine protease AprX
MRKARMAVVQVSAAILSLALAAGPSFAQAPPRIDPLAARRAALIFGSSRVIVSAIDVGALPGVTLAVQLAGGTVRRALPIINAYVADVPNAVLLVLANNPLITHIALDRVVAGSMERTGPTVGATAVRQELGYDGSGVGVAVIDSGVTAWHDDLTGGGIAQRVDRFVDFVNGRQRAYDDYGHGTHVAGIIAGNGLDSSGARAGIAPNARVIALKVLDRAGRGRISDVITALDYVVANKAALNIRIVNLSVATGVYESYLLDPLTLAAQRAVAAGVVVVAAAGNFGRDRQGRTMYGGITAPGNAPWVLTVGASSHMGTIDRSDDTVAAFSSRGPTAIDHGAKPDLVAPGVGIESLADPNSAFYTTQSRYLLPGTVPTTYLPYLSQSGTSMSAPVVSGTVALMLHANPLLTPNEVKAILQYTAQWYPRYDAMTQGTGFLNAKGAVELADYFARPASGAYPSSYGWSARLLWGNHFVSVERLTPDANAWRSDVIWGGTTTPDGQPIGWSVWPTTNGDTVVWGTSDNGDTVVWGTSDGDTVVWGTSCTDPSCSPVIWNQ